MTTTGPALLTAGRASLQAEAGNPESRFSRYRYELPLLTVFLVLAGVELVAVHLLLSLWSVAAAWVLSALSAVAMAQIALLIRGMKRTPTVVDDERVEVCYGQSGKCTVPLANIRAAEFVAYAPEEKGRDTFRATLLAGPNVALRLSEPIAIRRRQVSTITMRLDEPEAFLQELETRRRRRPAV